MLRCFELGTDLGGVSSLARAAARSRVEVGGFRQGWPLFEAPSTCRSRHRGGSARPFPTLGGVRLRHEVGERPDEWARVVSGREKVGPSCQRVQRGRGRKRVWPAGLISQVG